MAFERLCSRLALRLVLILVSYANLVSPAEAQGAACQPEWSPQFGAAPGVVGGILAEQVFDDGNGPALFVCGWFPRAGGVACHGVARWDGAHWSNVGGGIGGVGAPNTLPFAAAMAVFDDGSGPALFVGGNFSTAGGVPALNIAKWDGVHWSAVGNGLGSAPGVYAPFVNALAVFDDGQGSALYAGGSFESSGGTMLKGIAKWDGTNWLPVGSGVHVNNGDSVLCLRVCDLGSGPRLYAGGRFQSMNGHSAHGLARWDGSTWSALGSGVNGGVNSLCTFADASGLALYVGGSFNTAGGITSYGLARWSGTSWSGIAGTLIGSWLVRSLATFDDGTGSALYVGGNLSNPAGMGSAGIVKWTGTQWYAVGGGVNGYLSAAALVVHDDGSGPSLFVGGDFPYARGVYAGGAAKWNGTQWSTLGGDASAIPDTILALATHDSGSGPSLYAAVANDLAIGPQVRGVRMWNGSGWSWIASATNGNSLVNTLASFDGGTGARLFAGGSFLALDGVAAQGIAQWDGQQWSPLGTGLGTTLGSGGSAHVAALCVHDDGSGPALYAGGRFDSAGGVPAYSIARWNGTQWSPVGTGFGPPSSPWVINEVQSLAVHDDGHGPALYAAGSFAMAMGAPADFIAKWDGTQWSQVGCLATDSISVVSALVSYDDGSGPKLYACGSFDSIGGNAANGLARWDGVQWSEFGGGVTGVSQAAAVYSMCVFDDGGGSRLFVSGDFDHAGGQSANRIARWDGQAWTGMQSGLDAPASAMTVFDDGVHGSRLCAAGSFRDSPAGDTHIASWGCSAQVVGGFCFGDGSSSTQVACPCANTGVAGRGCENSVATGGAQLRASGDAFADTLNLTAQGEPAGALTIFLQGDAQNPAGVLFGDGVRCVAGALKRLYVKSAIGGSATAPGPSDPSIRQQSASVGDPIAHGTRRWYQALYRDPDASFCPAPQGGTFNASGGIEVRW